jgi:hypothetical protein
MAGPLDNGVPLTGDPRIDGLTQAALGISAVDRALSRTRSALTDNGNLAVIDNGVNAGADRQLLGRSGIA